MSPMVTDLEKMETRVTAAEPIRGESGDTEIVVQQSSEFYEEPQMHRFIFEYFHEPDDLPEGYDYTGLFVSWESSTEQLVLDDFLAFEHVERYLRAHRIDVGRHLGDDMYRPTSDAELLENDVKLETKL